MFVLVFMVSATAGCLIMFPIIKEVAHLYGFEPGEAWPKHMIIGATYVACTGYMLLPFKSLPVVVFASYAQLSGQSINIGPYILCTIAMTVASMLIFLAVLKFVLKPDMSKITNNNIIFEEIPRLNSYQRWFLVTSLSLLCCYYGRLLLPKLGQLPNLSIVLGIREF